MKLNENGFISDEEPRIVLFDIGFRIFFMGAGFFSILSVFLWAAIYLFQFSFSLQSISPFQWHAHEMIYGYCIAVIAGFLLTAVKNWTGVQTVKGNALILLFSLWLGARLCFIFGEQYLYLTAIFDGLFGVFLVAAIAYPIIKAKQWNQLLILSKVVLLVIFNFIFYFGALNIMENGVTLGVYAGLYLVIGIIFNMGRRVLPFFIEKGVGYQLTVFNAKWLDVSIYLLFTSFFISEIFFNSQLFSAYFALGLFFLNAIRLSGWYSRGIWNKSLLWSIYLAFWFICIGFLMFSGVYFVGIPKSIAIHALTVGGVGVFTLGMMCRISLGHTGRDVSQPPKAVAYALGILILGGVVRVFLPLFDVMFDVMPDVLDYDIWIGFSQVLWLLSFLIFAFIYFPMLLKSRTDGRPG